MSTAQKSFLESLSSASDLMNSLNLVKLSQDSSSDISIHGDYFEEPSNSDVFNNSALVYPHPSSSITTPSSTTVSSAKLRIPSRNIGLSPTSQRQLDTELKRLRLGQQQYEMLHSYEERKIITRMALKLARSSTNLETIILRGKKTRSAQRLPQIPVKNSAAPLATARSKTAVVRHIPDEDDNYLSESFNETLSDCESTTASNSTTNAHPKKTVRWQIDSKTSAKSNHEKHSFDRMNSGKNESTNKANESFRVSSHYGRHIKVGKANIYELSKKYAELRLKYPNTKPISILPKLVAYT
jgi:hypothetical protein